MQENFDPDHPSVATFLNNLAELYHLQSKYADAIPLQKHSLEIFETALGPGHPDVATSLNCLAILLVNKGKYTKVEPLYERTLKIRENTLGIDHHDVAVILENMAEFYEEIKKKKRL